VEAEQLAEERRAKAKEEARLRKEERDEKILKLRAASEASEVCLTETLRSIERHDVEISRLREAFTAASEARAAELATVGVLEQELSTSREAIKALVAAQERDSEATSKELSNGQAEAAGKPVS